VDFDAGNRPWKRESSHWDILQVCMSELLSEDRLLALIFFQNVIIIINNLVYPIVKQNKDILSYAHR
jgi:hypothetical protein